MRNNGKELPTKRPDTQKQGRPEGIRLDKKRGDELLQWVTTHWKEAPSVVIMGPGDLAKPIRDALLTAKNLTPPSEDSLKSSLPGQFNGERTIAKTTIIGLAFLCRVSARHLSDALRFRRALPIPTAEPANGSKSSGSDELALIALKMEEAIFWSEVRHYDLEAEQFIDLKTKGLAARVDRLAHDPLFMLPELSVLSAVAEGASLVEDIEKYTDLPSKAVEDAISSLKSWITNESSKTALRPRHIKLAVFDWSNTLALEDDLDDAINKFIYSGTSPQETLANKSKYEDLLESLRKQHSPGWYDYISLCRQFGKDENGLYEAHKKNISRLKLPFDISRMITALKKAGIQCVLMTNCHSKILQWRFGLHSDLRGKLKEWFDLVITSDCGGVKYVADKTYHYHAIRQHYQKIEPVSWIVVGDDHKTDLTPAKALGCATVWILTKPRIERLMTEPSPMPYNRDLIELLRKSIGENRRVADFCVSSAETVTRIAACS